MRRRMTLRLFMAASAVTAASVVGAPAAVADDTYDYPAGTACTFALKIVATGRLTGLVDAGPASPTTATSGGTLLTAGRGRALTFTNGGTGESASVSAADSGTVSLKASGSVTRTTRNADGSDTVSTGGHNVIILYPGDFPAGPSTKLYVGSLVYRVDPDFTFTVQKFSGRATDICALLS